MGVLGSFGTTWKKSNASLRQVISLEMSFGSLSRFSNAIADSLSGAFGRSQSLPPSQQQTLPGNVDEKKSAPATEPSLQSMTIPATAPIAPVQQSPFSFASSAQSFITQVHKQLQRSRSPGDEQADQEPFSWQKTLVTAGVFAALLAAQIYLIQVTYNAAFPSSTYEQLTFSRAVSLWLFVQILFAGF